MEDIDQANSRRSTKDAADMYQDGTYFDNNKSWHVEDSPWKARQIRALLTRNNIRPDSVCEVGCGAGEILKQLSASMPSTNFTGYELSPQAFELCKTRQSEKVQYRFENILDEDVFYDCLLCIDVFEHVEDCIGFLRSLKPKATYKVFHIPLDISMLAVWRGSMMTARQSVGHLHYFTPDTALATLRDSGYQVIDSFHTQYLSDLPSKSILSKIKKIPRKILYRVAPDLIVKILGGYSLIVLAK